MLQRIIQWLLCLMGDDSHVGWAFVSVREPAGGQSASQSPLSAGAAWFLYLERSGRGRAWDPPDLRILRQAAVGRLPAPAAAEPPPPPRARRASGPVEFRAVDGVATLRNRRRLRVQEAVDSFFPVEETVSLGSRWARLPADPHREGKGQSQHTDPRHHHVDQALS